MVPVKGGDWLTELGRVVDALAVDEECPEVV
jgi:hypothetical protein